MVRVGSRGHFLSGQRSRPVANITRIPTHLIAKAVDSRLRNGVERLGAETTDYYPESYQESDDGGQPPRPRPDSWRCIPHPFGAAVDPPDHGQGRLLRPRRQRPRRRAPEYGRLLGASGQRGGIIRWRRWFLATAGLPPSTSINSYAYCFSPSAVPSYRVRRRA
jgi:hypothetical protein